MYLIETSSTSTSFIVYMFLCETIYTILSNKVVYASSRGILYDQRNSHKNGVLFLSETIHTIKLYIKNIISWQISSSTKNTVKRNHKATIIHMQIIFIKKTRLSFYYVAAIFINYFYYLTI